MPKIDLYATYHGEKANSGINKTTTALKGTEKQTKKTEKSSKSMFKTFALGAVAIMAARKAFLSLKNTITDSIEKYKVQEDSERRLKQALIETGQASVVSLSQLKS